MAIYHMTISNVSRSKGSTACATLSYITADRVEDERLGQTFYGFGGQDRITATGTLLPEGAPEAFQDPAVMVNSIEQYEHASTARTAKKIEYALPRECTREQHIQMTEQWIRENITAKGYGATYAIHYDKDGNNPHTHVLVPNRKIDPQAHGWAHTKTRKEYAIDEKGKRIPIIDRTTGEQKVDSRNRKQWKRVTVEQNDLDRKEYLQELRASWAKECNRYLAPGQEIDHRSNAERGIEEEPTIHEGHAARVMAARGEISERIRQNEEIKERNSLLARIKETLKGIGDKITGLVREKGEFQNERIGNLFARRTAAVSRGTADRERTTQSGEIGTFVADLAAQERAAGKERADREAAAERHRIEERARIATAELAREEESRSHSIGIGR